MTGESLGALLEEMASGEPGPSAGSAAGVATATAAALVAKTARLSGRQLGDAEERAAAADALRERAHALADADARGVRAMLTAAPDAPADPSAIPREIGEVADAVGRLAADLAAHANPRLRADAAAAGHLAAAARAVIDGIVRSNAAEPG